MEVCEDIYTKENSLKSGVYGLRCTITNKWYVGETKNKIVDRWNDYERLGCKEQPKLYRAIVKYGWNNFKKSVLEILPPDKKLLQEREVFWIHQLDSFNNGYNCNIGGYSNCGKSLKGKPKSTEHRKKLSEANKGKPGRQHSEETKKKISLLKIGEKHPLWGTKASEETRSKMSISHIGKIRTEEHQKKLNESNTGKKRSEESKKRMSESAKLYWSKKKQNTDNNK